RNQAHVPAATPGSGVGASGGPKKAPTSECVLYDFCGNEVADFDWTSGSRCTSGHTLCADCTVKYVQATLLPWGIVWSDTIKCVQRRLRRVVVDSINASQRRFSSWIGPEASRREGERVAKANAPCPNCTWPNERIAGPGHMVCVTCKHNYCWFCRCTWTRDGHRCKPFKPP
ncbi:unnamed protein product, partial [Ectocarpus fasciculatus]